MARNKFAIRLFAATLVRKFRVFKYRLKGYDIPYSAKIEGTVILDKLNPGGIHIGANTLVAGGAVVLSHEHHKRVGENEPYCVDTFIGKRCFIGINAVIMPGIKIGDEVIVGAGSIVTKSVESNCIVAGNPARVLRKGIVMNNLAALEN